MTGRPATTGVVPKATALLLRDGGSGKEVLVFDHPMPTGGVSVQLPAGSVEPLEAPSEAVVRELFEETGVRGRVIALAGIRDEVMRGERRRRWIYAVEPEADVENEWSFHCDCGRPTTCHWVPVETAQVHPLQVPWLQVGLNWLRNGSG